MREERPDTAPGTVLPTLPVAVVSKGRSVDLVVAQTRQQEDVEVPNLRGLTLDEAGSRLTELGLQIGKTYAEEPTAETAPGSIIDQNPPPGTVVEPGSSVDFVYAEKEGPLTGGLLRLPSTPRDTTVNRDVSILVPEGPDTEVVVIVVDDFGTREVHRELASGGATLVIPVRAQVTAPGSCLYGRQTGQGTTAPIVLKFFIRY